LYIQSNEISKRSLEALGFETSKGFGVFTPEQTECYYFNYEECLTHMFRGMEPLYSKMLKPLSEGQVESLTQLGILVEPNKVYTRGLASTATVSGKPLDLMSLKVFIDNQISVLAGTEQLELLQEQYIENRAQLLYSLNKISSSELERLMKEQRSITSQIGTLVLPPGFFLRIKNPVSFVQTTAPQIGRYTLAMLYESDIEYVDNTVNEYTSWVLSFESLYEEPLETNARSPYPSIEETRREQEQWLTDQRSKLTSKLQSEIETKLMNATQSELADLYDQVRNLRPKMSEIKKQYAGKEDPDIIDKIVTLENYNYLPQVRVTKAQQNQLFNLIEEEPTFF
jgi:hypothetical protein